MTQPTLLCGQSVKPSGEPLANWKRAICPSKLVSLSGAVPSLQALRGSREETGQYRRRSVWVLHKFWPLGPFSVVLLRFLSFLLVRVDFCSLVVLCRVLIFFPVFLPLLLNEFSSVNSEILIENCCLSHLRSHDMNRSQSLRLMRKFQKLPVWLDEGFSCQFGS